MAIFRSIMVDGGLDCRLNPRMTFFELPEYTALVSHAMPVLDCYRFPS